MIFLTSHFQFSIQMEISSGNFLWPWRCLRERERRTEKSEERECRENDFDVNFSHRFFSWLTNTYTDQWNSCPVNIITPASMYQMFWQNISCSPAGVKGGRVAHCHYSWFVLSRLSLLPPVLHVNVILSQCKVTYANMSQVNIAYANIPGKLPMNWCYQCPQKQRI